MAFFWYNRDGNYARPITAREADREHRNSDAGTDDAFVVEAPKHSMALEGAARWVAVRGDDEISEMPDDLFLVERHYTTWKTYMTLRVAAL